MEPKKKRKIGEILIEDGLLSKAQLEEALAFQKEKGGVIGQILIEKKTCGRGVADQRIRQAVRDSLYPA